MNRTLDVIIVNWNSGEHLRQCLGSVQSLVRDGYEFDRIVVVDNASTDLSANSLSIPEIPLTITRNSENRGFARACNQGARASQADYLLFLNPDVRLEPESLAKVIQFLEEPANSKFAICGIQLFDSQKMVSRTCARFPTAKSLIGQMFGLDRAFPQWVPGHFLPRADHLKSGEVDQVMGAFFVVRREVFEFLSGFDRRFFVYFEDVDFSYRAFRSGWRSFYLAESRGCHKGGGCSEQVKASRLCYSLESKILYAFKHFGYVSAIAVLLGILLIEPLSRLALAVAHWSFEDMEATIRGYFMLWASLLKSLLRRGDSSVRGDGPNHLESVA